MYKSKNKWSSVGLYIFLGIILVFMIVPFIWLVISSFRPNADLFTEPFSIPKTLSVDNFRAVLESQPMLLYFRNTVMIALIATFLSISSATLAAYGMMGYFFSRKILTAVFFMCLFIPTNATVMIALIATFLSISSATLAAYGMMGYFFSRKILTAVFFMCLFIPTNAFLVPYYVMINKIGLYDSVMGIALVYAGVNFPMSFMVIKGYMDTIPYELLESAKIDGATTGQIFKRIILPMSKPGIVTACVFLVINSWNELLFANLLNQSDSSRTIQVAIRSFLTTFEANYAYAFAAMVLSILPTIVVYALLTDRIIDGMTAGAVKG